ncbi:MAG: metallophosphoesterase [Blautia sp.]|nr:metallophosphoesterase [Blautia sp.]
MTRRHRIIVGSFVVTVVLGYDVINKSFFVETYIGSKKDRSIFSDFDSYYRFLERNEGNIYDNACYYQYIFSQKEVDAYNIDLNRINTIALIDCTCSDFSAGFSSSELESYNEIEKDKEFRKEWIAKFNSCNTYEEFQKMVCEFENSYSLEGDLCFFISNFIFADQDKAYDIVMQYIAQTLNSDIENTLCFVHGAQKVLSDHKYDKTIFSPRISSHKQYLKEMVRRIENKEITFREQKYFDKDTHFFCYKLVGDYIVRERENDIQVCRYFETFDEFAEYLNNDLSDCDLSKAILSDIDFSCYKTNEYTKLSVQDTDQLRYVIIKKYDRIERNFIVIQRWLNENGQVIKEYKNIFDYFFDFLYFLENDLSGADLLFCDGLINLHDLSNVNYANVTLRSEVWEKLNMPYQCYSLSNGSMEEFSLSVKNEEETADVLAVLRKETKGDKDKPKISYISDLHLIHRLQKVPFKNEGDIVLFIQNQIIDGLLKEMCGSDILLIGGDTASDFNIFRMFVRLLRKSMDERDMHVPVIFLLGNHELWGFPNSTFDEIVPQYEREITGQGMYLLQNEIIYIEKFVGWKSWQLHKITTQELLSMSRKELRVRLNCALFIFFGGLAFSGYNEEFNANNGIYRSVIDREQEIAESKKFEHLYEIVLSNLSDRSVVVFTHTPKKDWCADSCCQGGFVYVSGHTHRNEFYDDGENRIYADNQMGYQYANAHLKYFRMERYIVDWFAEYEDGIHEITKQQYLDFYREKNMSITFTRDVYKLIMLKKSGYYCFLQQYGNGLFAILNGGKPIILREEDINYYYEKMDMMIAKISTPLDKYTSIQQKIADEVKIIGGRGSIHGAIIDIDFYSHIYVNPFDGTITGYWAKDIKQKTVFPSIPKLLKKKCPALYQNYLENLESKDGMLPSITNSQKLELDTVEQEYLDTSIYAASNEIRKMQKLYNNVLTTWYEPGQKMLE